MKEGEVVLVSDARYEIEDRELYRLLGYRKGKELSSEEVRGVVDELKVSSADLIEPRGAFVIKSRDEIEERGPFTKAEKVGLGLCTVGAALEDRVRELFDTGHFLEGLVLDTIGSVAVDSVADSINYRICDQGEAVGLTAYKRSSPGYGSWALEEQRLFFDLLPHEKLGMDLTPSFMMVPRKSISFAVNLMRDGNKTWKTTRCARCGMIDCSFREEKKGGDG